MEPRDDKSSSFLNLPAEIRMAIYDYVFEVPGWQKHQQQCSVRARFVQHYCQHCGPCTALNTMEKPPHYPPARVGIKQDDVFHPSRYIPNVVSRCERCPIDSYAPEDSTRERSALLRVCKTTYSEARDVLYDSTLFAIGFSMTDVTWSTIWDRCDIDWIDMKDSKTYNHEPVSMKSATQLGLIRHLNLFVRVNQHWEEMIPYLETLVDVLPSLSRLKSATVFLDLIGMHRRGPCSECTREGWIKFTQLIARLPRRNYVKLLYRSRSIKDQKKEHSVLCRALGGEVEP